jgi:glycosyltransferase involved in cell wall biosynthesis
MKNQESGKLMSPCSNTHLVLIPSYNPGAKVIETVSGARQYWCPVWVVVDGSDDGSPSLLADLANNDPGLRVIFLPENQGKGAAVLQGMRMAKSEGYTHVLTMDSDGQHPAALIPSFMQASDRQLGAMILGNPIFDDSAPILRVQGRRISNGWAQLETLWSGIGDSLFGFRVYPIAPLVSVMQKTRWMRRFDFDPEAAVRMSWAGIPMVNLPAPVKYFKAEDGGVSHFNYWQDNALLTWMHTRLMLGFLIRLPRLLTRRMIPGRPWRVPPD